MNKKRFSMDEHFEVGRKLREVDSDLKNLITKVGNRYPVSSNALKYLYDAVEDISQVRNDLDNSMFADYGNDERCQPNVYYGKISEIEE